MSKKIHKIDNGIHHIVIQLLFINNGSNNQPIINIYNNCGNHFILIIGMITSVIDVSNAINCPNTQHPPSTGWRNQLSVLCHVLNECKLY